MSDLKDFDSAIGDVPENEHGTDNGVENTGGVDMLNPPDTLRDPLSDASESRLTGTLLDQPVDTEEIEATEDGGEAIAPPSKRRGRIALVVGGFAAAVVGVVGLSVLSNSESDEPAAKTPAAAAPVGPGNVPPSSSEPTPSSVPEIDPSHVLTTPNYQKPSPEQIARYYGEHFPDYLGSGIEPRWFTDLGFDTVSPIYEAPYRHELTAQTNKRMELTFRGAKDNELTMGVYSLDSKTDPDEKAALVAEELGMETDAPTVERYEIDGFETLVTTDQETGDTLYLQPRDTFVFAIRIHYSSTTPGRATPESVVAFAQNATQILDSQYRDSYTGPVYNDRGQRTRR